MFLYFLSLNFNECLELCRSLSDIASFANPVTLYDISTWYLKKGKCVYFVNIDIVVVIYSAYYCVTCKCNPRSSNFFLIANDKSTSQDLEANEEKKKMEESGSSSLVNHEETIENFNSPDATAPGEVGSGGLYFPTRYDGAGSPVIANVTSVEDLKEKVTLSWRNINVFVPQPGPSLCKRLCGGQKDDEPRVRQILFDGEFEMKS